MTILDFVNNMSIITILVLPALFVVLSCLFLHIRSNSQRSKLPPGPRPLPVIGNLASLDLDLHTYFASLKKEYGPIYKLWLGRKIIIVVSSPSLAHEVLKENDITFANRDIPNTSLVATYGGNDLASLPYGAQWKMLRKVCVQKMLNKTTLDLIYCLRRIQVRQTVSYLHKKSGSPVDIGVQVFLTIFNVVTNMLWGGTVEGEERAIVGVEFRQVVSEITDLLGQPNISDFFPALAVLDLQGLRRKMDKCIKKLDKIFESMIDRRIKLDAVDQEKEGGSVGGTEDFLHILLKLMDDGDSKPPLTMNNLKGLLMDMIVAGSDTTSNSIEFALAELINKPEVMKKAQKELEDVVGKNNIVEESHIHQLPYLHCVVKENFRLHPTAPLLLPHCTSKACKVGGYTVPKGAAAYINVWAIHRDPTIWENPLEFKPERFFESKFEYNGTDFRYFPFGSGRRQCVGIALAERMLMYSLATLMHSFDWKLPQGKKLEVTEKFALALKLKDPLVLIPVPRLSDSKLYE